MKEAITIRELFNNVIIDDNTKETFYLNDRFIDELGLGYGNYNQETGRICDIFGFENLLKILLFNVWIFTKTSNADLQYDIKSSLSQYSLQFIYPFMLSMTLSAQLQKSLSLYEITIYFSSIFSKILLISSLSFVIYILYQISSKSQAFSFVFAKYFCDFFSFGKIKKKSDLRHS